MRISTTKTEDFTLNILALNHNRKIIPMWINSAKNLRSGMRNITRTIKYKRLAEKSAGCIRQRNPHEERPAPKENNIYGGIKQ